MPTIRVSVVVEVDDIPVANFPFFYRASPNAAQSIADVQATGASFFTIPTTAMATIQTAILQSSQATAVAFNGVTATPITMNAGGVLLVLGASLSALSVQNNSGANSNLRGFVAGV